MSFEDWKDKELARGESKTWIEWCGEAYEAGAASRQTEIDAALKQRDSFIKAHHIAMDDVCNLKAERDELQKRIDEALDLLHASSEHRTQVPVSRLFWLLKGK